MKVKNQIKSTFSLDGPKQSKLQNFDFTHMSNIDCGSEMILFRNMTTPFSTRSYYFSNNCSYYVTNIKEALIEPSSFSYLVFLWGVAIWWLNTKGTNTTDWRIHILCSYKEIFQRSKVPLICWLALSHHPAIAGIAIKWNFSS